MQPCVFPGIDGKKIWFVGSRPHLQMGIISLLFYSIHSSYNSVISLVLFHFRDGDGILNSFDNCLDLPNGDQADADGDDIGSYFTSALQREYFMDPGA